MRYFITGTDTNVGKTVIAAALTLKLQATYWKPIQTGLDSDTRTVQQLTELNDQHFMSPAYHFSEPVSPDAAADLENQVIDLHTIPIPTTSPLIVEGAGGVYVPLNAQHTMLNLMQRLNLPVIVVARTTLGTINHTLLTLNVLKQHGLTVAGLILNGEPHPRTRASIIQHSGVDVLADIPILPDMNPQTLKTLLPRIHV